MPHLTNLHSCLGSLPRELRDLGGLRPLESLMTPEWGWRVVPSGSQGSEIAQLSKPLGFKVQKLQQKGPGVPQFSQAGPLGCSYLPCSMWG